MRYRVSFSLSTGPRYYTEWFESLGEAEEFVKQALLTEFPYIHEIEDEHGNIV